MKERQKQSTVLCVCVHMSDLTDYTLEKPINAPGWRSGLVLRVYLFIFCLSDPQGSRAVMVDLSKGRQEQLLWLLSFQSGPNCPHSIQVLLCDFVFVDRKVSAFPLSYTFTRKIRQSGFNFSTNQYSAWVAVKYLAQNGIFACISVEIQADWLKYPWKWNFQNIFESNLHHEEVLVVLVSLCCPFGPENWPQLSDWCVIQDTVQCCALYSIDRHSGDSSVSCQHVSLWESIVQMLLFQTRKFHCQQELKL